LIWYVGASCESLFNKRYVWKADTVQGGKAHVGLLFVHIWVLSDFAWIVAAFLRMRFLGKRMAEADDFGKPSNRKEEAT
jgi:hypothetical protein